VRDCWPLSRFGEAQGKQIEEIQRWW
jgi:hypothetical protein